MDARHSAASSPPGGAAITPRQVLEVGARDLPRESADLVGFLRSLARCSKSTEVAAGLEGFLCVALGPCSCSVALVTEPGSDRRHPAIGAVRPAAGSRLIQLAIRYADRELGFVSIVRSRALFGAEHRIVALALHGAGAELQRIAAQEPANVRTNERSGSSAACRVPDPS